MARRPAAPRAIRSLQGFRQRLPKHFPGQQSGQLLQRIARFTQPPVPLLDIPEPRLPAHRSPSKTDTPIESENSQFGEVFRGIKLLTWLPFFLDLRGGACVKLRMTRLPRYLLSDSEKDALLHKQAALIEREAAMIETLTERIAALEAELGKPRKTARNSHLPPSQDPARGKGTGTGASPASGKKRTKKPRPSRLGVPRVLAPLAAWRRHRTRRLCARPVTAFAARTCRA